MPKAAFSGISTAAAPFNLMCTNCSNEFDLYFFCARFIPFLNLKMIMNILDDISIFLRDLGWYLELNFRSWMIF